MRWLIVLVLWSGCTRAAADDHAQAAFDRYRQPDKLIAALALRPGQRVADVGAGSGYLTARLARAVGPDGRVVATDIDGDALRALEQSLEPTLRGRVQVRRVEAGDPGLEAGAYDVILLSEVDHLLRDRVAYLGKLRPALAPGGRIVVTNRRTYRAPLVDAATAAGLHVHERDVLQTHFLVEATP